MTSPYITVVSGLPRSGTSMMMRMLEAGGLPLLTDGERGADTDNPHGYFELEAVKRTQVAPAWLERAPGRAVKVISELLPQLPHGPNYRVIFMRRQLDEVLASQRRMLVRRNELVAADDDAQTLKELFVAHLARVEQHLRERDAVRVRFVSYNRAIEAPEITAQRVSSFLDGQLDVRAMVRAVDPALYRNRHA